MKTDARSVANSFISIFQKPVEQQRSRFIPENDQKIILSNLRFTETIFPQSALMLCPISHATKYVSKNCEAIFGHNKQVMEGMDLAEVFQLVHPDDLTPVKQCFDFVRSCEPYDPENSRFVLYYRIRSKDGTYVHVKDEKLSIKTVNGNYLYLMMFTNLVDEKFYHVRMDIFKSLKGNYIKAYTYNPRQGEQSITPRQTDIVRLIIKGFTNQEIADQLNVSIFTVKNHKRVLFRKANVKNSMELANAVGNGVV
jgi:PAS domain S-box-containing protein